MVESNNVRYPACIRHSPWRQKYGISYPRFEEKKGPAANKRSVHHSTDVNFVKSRRLVLSSVPTKLPSGDSSATPRPSTRPRSPLPPGRSVAGLRSTRSSFAGRARSRFARWIYNGSPALGNSVPADASLLKVGVFSPRCFCARLALVIFFMSVLEAKILAAGCTLHLLRGRRVFVRMWSVYCLDGAVRKLNGRRGKSQ